MKINIKDCLEPATEVDANKTYATCEYSSLDRNLSGESVYAPSADDDNCYNKVDYIHYMNNHAYLVSMIEDYQKDEKWVNIGNNTWVKLGGTLEDNRQYDKHKTESVFSKFIKVEQDYYTVYYV